MKCCVQNCVNSGEKKKINQPSNNINKRITYHLFPKHPEQRETWLQSLNIPNMIPTNRTFICSNHFKEDDFYITKQGSRRIKYGVVPFIEDDCYGPAALRVCKLCLSLDSKMYQLRDHGLYEMYEDIMGMPPRIDAQNRLPMGICWECTARLQSASAFRSKALFSDALLEDHLKNNADLKIIDIQNILQDNDFLKSTISIQKVFKLNSHNIEDYAPNTFMKTEVLCIPDNEEIEVEAKKLARDKNIMKDERKYELIKEGLPNTDFKNEVDLKPNTETDSGEDDYGDDISDDDVKTLIKKVPVNKTRRGLKKALKNEKELESVDIAANLSETMDTEGDDFEKMTNEDDDDEKRNVSDGENLKINRRNKAVKRVKVKPNVRKNKYAAARKKKSDKVKVEQRAKKEPYPRPSTHVDENIFSVKMLDHDDLRREILARRDSDKYIYADYKCDVCFKGFTTKDRKERHMVKHSEQSGPIVCDICHVRSMTGRRYREHMKATHTMEFICKLCPMITRLKNVAIGHMKYHAGSKYKCTQCSAEFEKPTTLQSHLRLRHMSACVCELCGYTFLSKKGVHLHKRIIHKLFDENTKFKGPHCDVCNVKFLNHKAYKLHLRLSSKHITEDDPKRMNNDPTIAPRRFSWGTPVKPVMRPVIHIKRENTPVNNGPITCEQCGVVQDNLREYASHFKYAHPGVTRIQSTYATTPYMCAQCGKFFVNSTLLACHMWVHTGQKLFQCDHCNRKFSMKGKLAHHIRHEHEGPRRTFGCPECGKHFSFNYNLTRHMFIHTGLRSFTCEFCEKTFITSGELRAHIDHVHLKKPRPKRPKQVRHRAVKREPSDDGDDEKPRPKLIRRRAVKREPSDDGDDDKKPRPKLIRRRAVRRERSDDDDEGLRPFSCEFCEKTFITSGELRAHINHVHLKKPRPKRVRRRAVKRERSDDDDDDN